MTTPAETRFGKYLLRERIAVGGMAEVFRGRLIGQQGFEKPIVIKKMLPQVAADPEMVAHFIDEARLAALLQHDNIVHVYDFGEVDGAYFISMEYLAGRDLKSVLRAASLNGVPFGAAHALFIAARICEGLDYAHNLKDLQGVPLNIIHRDISPPNIFLTTDGKVKIIDFGIAKTDAQSTTTRHGIIKGKVAYMSPEQAAGQPIDRRSDIFAVGALLYEMLTAKHLYAGDTMEVFARALAVRYEPPETIVPDLPPGILRILARALAGDPEARYPSCGAMLADIERCSFDLGYRAAPREVAAFMETLCSTADAKEPAGDGAEQAPPGGDHTATLAVVADGTRYRTADADVANERRKESGKKLRAMGERAASFARLFTRLRRLPGARRKRIAGLAAALLLCALGVALLFAYRGEARKVQDLLTRADQALATDHLTTPPQASAFYYYNEVLKLEADNPEALQGLDAIGERYADLAAKAQSSLRLIRANNYIDAGLAVCPQNERLLAMKKGLAPGTVFTRMKEALQVPAAPGDAPGNASR